jgi:hypothetical protein
MHEPAGPLRHVDGFPVLGLLPALRPTPRPSADDAPSRHDLPGWQATDGNPGVVPTFTTNRSTGEVASYAPATSPRLRRRLHRGLPTGDINQPRSSPPVMAWVRIAIQPVSTGFELAVALEGLYTAGSSRPPSRLACRTHTIRWCWCVPSLSGLLPTLSGVSRIRLPPASPPCCDRTAVAVSHPHSVRGASWRSMSHDQH